MSKSQQVMTVGTASRIQFSRISRTCAESRGISSQSVHPLRRRNQPGDNPDLLGLDFEHVAAGADHVGARRPRLQAVEKGADMHCRPTGHTKPTTTLQWHAHWRPGADQALGGRA
jgi:hypothetical protein